VKYNGENPFKYSDSIKRYHTYDYYLKSKFGSKCFKVPIDGGFTCPNLDGTKGFGGCTYCGGAYNSTMRTLSVGEQFESQLEALHRKWPKADKYIAYFQSFTNTYAPAAYLREKYEAALSHDGVVGLSIATRADSLEDDAVEYLRELNERTFLTVELGLQTVHDTTAARINRGHSMEDFLRGYEKLKGLNVCVHLINGLPGEDREMMLETARIVAALHPHSLKLHLLYVIRGTKLAKQFEAGEFSEMTMEDYIDITVSQLELFAPETVIGRVTGDGKRDELIAPLWSQKKFAVINDLDKAFINRRTWQGRLYHDNII